MNLLMSWHLFLQVAFLIVAIDLTRKVGRHFFLVVLAGVALPVYTWMSPGFTVAEWLSQDITAQLISIGGLLHVGNYIVEKLFKRRIAPVA